MAVVKRPYGKDDPTRFIDDALHGGGEAASEGIHDQAIGRGQTIKTAVALDNVDLAMPIETSILDEKFAGGIDNLEHSLTGASAVNDKLGAAGRVKEGD